MTQIDAAQVIVRFREQVDELAGTYYEENLAQAFRHAAFQLTAPDPSISDAQVIELTAIDKTGDLEIDGWFVDDTSEVFFLFQCDGSNSRVDEGKLAKFWESPTELANPARVAATPNQSVKELAPVFVDKLRDEYSLRMVFVAKGGFAPSAEEFAKSRSRADRAIQLADGTRVVFPCTLEWLDEKQLAKKFDDYRAGFLTMPTDVELKLEQGYSYPVERQELRSIRATIRASEIVRVFRAPGMGYRLFSLNPRGPIANAKVNKNIAKTLDSPKGRREFHLLNNGLCATCDSFEEKDRLLVVKNFQIVNGCQTTVTLDARTDAELEETLIDIKLAVADVTLAEAIASASNSQTALRAKDYASFERRQRQLQYEFGMLQLPWYYEIKQGYWRFVLNDREKARFKTGRRKRHIEVQPLAQASLAFGGYPAEALDRVRFVFQGIRSGEEREWYERAFPQAVTAQQLLVPWLLLDFIERQDDRLKFSTFHLLGLVARMLRVHYQLGSTDYFSRETSAQLIGTISNWLPGLFRVANRASRMAVRSARNIMRASEIELRDFFRASGELSPGVSPIELLNEACDEELKNEVAEDRDPSRSLPG